MIKKATNVQYGYTIEGNTIQDGVPSSQNPVIPEGTGDKTGNVMPAGEQKTVVNNGITFSSDGNGRYHISGTATAYASARFNLLSAFTTPISVSNGGQGTLSFFNTQSDNNITFIFYNGATKVDDWKQTPIRRTNTTYNAIGNKYVDNIVITVNSGTTVDITITPEFTNDGVLPSEYEPYGYKIPITSIGENLVDEVRFAPNYLRFYVSGLKKIVNTEDTFTLSFKSNISFINNSIYLNATGFSSHIIGTLSGTGNVSSTFTLTETDISNIKNSNDAWFHVYKSDTDFSTSSNIMLNSGSTALPYKPYIEPINTNIYLGEVESTRKIKKLVLTGEEDWKLWAMPSGSLTQRFYINISGVASHLSLCSHFIREDGNEDVPHFRFGGTSYNELIFFISNTIGTTADFKSYLATQYAAGTPVTVWYVLTTPEVSITNEPLMKIGNYVDTINNTQSGIDITTNNLTVNTTIPPSKIDITSTATWVPINYNKYNTETISTIAPIDFLSNGQNITVGVKGNTEQLEIPSPDNPVIPEGTGERTGNLLNLSYQNFTIKNIEVTAQGSIINFNGTSSGEISSGSVAWKVLTFTLPAGEYSINTTKGFSRYVKSVDGTTLLSDWQTNLTLSEETQCYLAFYFISGKTIDSDIEFMLNTGSTPQPYEPYGIKIPISSAGQTTPVYLGEVETTRKIKKLVLTGQENWQLQSINSYGIANIYIRLDAIMNIT